MMISTFDRVENIMEKGENAGSSILSFSHNGFYSFKDKFIIELLSANAFNMVKLKLTLYHTILSFNHPQRIKKHFENIV